MVKWPGGPHSAIWMRFPPVRVMRAVHSPTPRSGPRAQPPGLGRRVSGAIVADAVEEDGEGVIPLADRVALAHRGRPLRLIARDDPRCSRSSASSPSLRCSSPASGGFVLAAA